MLEKIKIPAALQITIDDLGWHDGRDLREIGQGSRSGLPRLHAVEDYTMMNELGKAIHQKILGFLCLVDWDKDNILRGEVGITHDPYGWDRASTIDMDYARACFAEMEKSEYIEYGVHTVSHGRYDEQGKRITEREIVEKGADGEWHPISAADLDRRLNLFFKIYNSWGFKQKPTVYREPASTPEKITPAELRELNLVLNRYGIRHFSTNWAYFHDKREILTYPVLYSAMNRRVAVAAEWDEYNFDVSKLPDVMLSGEKKLWPCLVLHWTNFLRREPKENLEYIKPWVEYFMRQSEIFGLMISRDYGFYFNQQMYYQFAKIEETDGGFVIDLSEMPKLPDDILKNEFCISLEKGIEPPKIAGGRIELYEEKQSFKTYKITDFGEKIEIKV